MRKYTILLDRTATIFPTFAAILVDNAAHKLRHLISFNAELSTIIISTNECPQFFTFSFPEVPRQDLLEESSARFHSFISFIVDALARHNN